MLLRLRTQRVLPRLRVLRVTPLDSISDAAQLWQAASEEGDTHTVLAFSRATSYGLKAAESVEEGNEFLAGAFAHIAASHAFEASPELRGYDFSDFTWEGM